MTFQKRRPGGKVHGTTKIEEENSKVKDPNFVAYLSFEYCNNVLKVVQFRNFLENKVVLTYCVLQSVQ